MALTEERRETLLAYCHLKELADDPEVKLLIPTFYEAAVSYMTEAGASEPEEGTSRRAQYDLCINAMVLSAYDNRSVSIVDYTESVTPVFRMILNQLKLTEGSG